MFASAHSAACLPARLPYVIVSISAFPPSRFAPWTETQAHSPAAYRPSTFVLPQTSVSTPPMW